MDPLTMGLDSLFWRHGIRFIPTSHTTSSKNPDHVMNPCSIINTRYWAERSSSKFNNDIFLAYKPVRTLIGIRKFLAMRSSGYYEKVMV